MNTYAEALFDLREQEPAPGARRMTVILAHPDDESFICGGTLAKYAAEGADITLICATRGEMGRRMGRPVYVTRESMPIVREQELIEACRALGIGRLIFLGIRDKTVEFVDETYLVSRLVYYLEELKPDVVLTFHEGLGGHPDHCAIGKAAKTAVRKAGDGPRLYFITFGEAMEHPEHYGYGPSDVVKIDIRKHLRAKLASFRAHRCQSEFDGWVWESDGRVLARFGPREYFLAGGPAGRAKADELFD